MCNAKGSKARLAVSKASYGFFPAHEIILAKSKRLVTGLL